MRNFSFACITFCTSQILHQANVLPTFKNETLKTTIMQKMLRLFCSQKLYSTFER
jgi:hypothetical protein